MNAVNLSRIDDRLADLVPIARDAADDTIACALRIAYLRGWNDKAAADADGTKVVRLPERARRAE